MAQYRVSFVFRAALAAAPTAGSVAGWTENIYWQPDVDAAGVEDHARNLLVVRARLLTSGWRCNKIRFAVFPSTRIAFSVNVTPGDGTGEYPFGAGVTDEQPYDVLLHNATCASGKGRSYPHRGIGSDVVDAGGNYTAPGAYTARYTNWVGQLTTGWAVRRSARVETLNIIGVDTAGTLGTFIASPFRPLLHVSGPPDSYFTGDSVRVSSTIGFGFLNGDWKVAGSGVVAGNNLIWLDQKKQVAVYGAYQGGGKVWKKSYTLDPINGSTPNQGSSHKTGGPSDRRRGRRSVRRS